MNDFRCYVCGKPLHAVFNLVSMSKDVDRVFLVHDGCADQLNKGDAVTIAQVERRRNAGDNFPKEER